MLPEPSGAHSGPALLPSAPICLSSVSPPCDTSERCQQDSKTKNRAYLFSFPSPPCRISVRSQPRLPWLTGELSLVFLQLLCSNSLFSVQPKQQAENSRRCPVAAKANQDLWSRRFEPLYWNVSRTRKDPRLYATLRLAGQRNNQLNYSRNNQANYLLTGGY